MNIFVASLDFAIQDSNLREVFEEYGEVSSVKIITDKFSGRSKGFGFIEMPNDDEALAAIQELNGVDLEGRSIVVKKAKPREDKGRSFNRGGGDFNRGY